MHQQFFPTLQKDDAAKTSCNTNRREGRLSAYQGTESSEHLECVSMEFTCSSSLKLPEDTVTPMVLHALESKPASNINISRVRSFLDHLACGDKLSHAVQNSSLKMMPGLPLEQNLQSMLPHASHCEKTGQAHEKLKCISAGHLTTLHSTEECTYAAINDGLNGTKEKPHNGTLKEGIAEEKCDDDTIAKQYVNMVCALPNDPSLCRLSNSDASIETLRDQDTDKTILSNCKVAIPLQDSRDKSFDECPVKSCQKDYGKVREASRITTNEALRANSTVTNEASGTKETASVNVGTTAGKELALFTCIRPSTDGKNYVQKPSLSTKRNSSTSAGSKQVTEKSKLVTFSVHSGEDINIKGTNLVEHFSALKLTPILPSSHPLSPQVGGPLTSTPVSTPDICLSRRMSTPVAPKFLPHTSTPDKPSTDKPTISIGSTMEMLLDFDEIGFDVSATVLQTAPKSPDHISCQEAAASTSLNNHPNPSSTHQEEKKHRAKQTLAKNHVLVRKPGMVKAAKPLKCNIDGNAGTTPPSCVLIRLHERASKVRKKVPYYPCAYKDVPDDILITVNKERPH